MFSKACEYGIKATIHIGLQSKLGERVSLKNVAKAIDSPEAFTAKILQTLAKDGIIHSSKGATGGYEISINESAKITLLQIVKSIDGDNIYTSCSLGLNKCNALLPCPLHEKFVATRHELIKMLTNTTIQDMAEGIDEGTTYFIR
jgi:Rrf2 family protein